MHEGEGYRKRRFLNSFVSMPAGFFDGCIDICRILFGIDVPDGQSERRVCHVRQKHTGIVGDIGYADTEVFERLFLKIAV